MGNNRPNIVMIMADQFVSNGIGALGHPFVMTPNIDRLVQAGISFNQCYCNSPLCVPSRASMLTSRFASNIEVYDNGSELRSSIPTFVHHLRRNGYNTSLAGKMHFIGPDQHHGFEERLSNDIHTAGFELTPDWSRGTYANHGTGVKRLQTPGLCDGNSQMNHDENTLNSTLDKIRMLGQERSNIPFFLCTSFTQPHDPFVITKEYWDMFKDMDVSLPKVIASPLDDIHPYNQWIQIHHEADVCSLSDEQIRNNRRAYYAMICYIDDKVGQIVRELERMKLMDNTIIIMTSDHGEMLGEHGMWFKRTFYDTATKVPLIITWPNQLPAGRTMNSVVSLVDLGPTLLKLAGIADADQWISESDGNSFAQLIYNNDTDWKDEAICEYLGEGPIHPMVSLRKGHFKYVHVHGCEPLLFDLENDPCEERNLVNQSEFITVKEELAAQIAERYNFEEIEQRILQSQRERLMMVQALQIGECIRWEYRKS